jgi:dTDP-4-amino-4,6-dideoxygalactose transaminase
VALLANHGRHDKYVHEIEGVNSRLDALPAAILRAKLRRLDDWNESRRRLAALYQDRLRDTGIGLPVADPRGEPVWHLFVVRVQDREAAQERLRQGGIATGVHYPVPLHLQPAYRHLGIAEGSLPVSERAAREILSLPMYPELRPEQVEAISAVLVGLPA